MANGRQPSASVWTDEERAAEPVKEQRPVVVQWAEAPCDPTLVGFETECEAALERWRGGNTAPISVWLRASVHRHGELGVLVGDPAELPLRRNRLAKTRLDDGLKCIPCIGVCLSWGMLNVISVLVATALIIVSYWMPERYTTPEGTTAHVPHPIMYWVCLLFWVIAIVLIMHRTERQLLAIVVKTFDAWIIGGWNLVAAIAMIAERILHGWPHPLVINFVAQQLVSYALLAFVMLSFDSVTGGRRRTKRFLVVILGFLLASSYMINRVGSYADAWLAEQTCVWLSCTTPKEIFLVATSNTLVYIGRYAFFFFRGWDFAIIRPNYVLRLSDKSRQPLLSGKADGFDDVGNSPRPAHWVSDSEVTTCQRCSTGFTCVRRKHHCRACGLVVCGRCWDASKGRRCYVCIEDGGVPPKPRVHRTAPAPAKASAGRQSPTLPAPHVRGRPEAEEEMLRIMTSPPPLRASPPSGAMPRQRYSGMTPDEAERRRTRSSLRSPNAEPVAAPAGAVLSISDTSLQPPGSPPVLPHHRGHDRGYTARADTAEHAAPSPTHRERRQELVASLVLRHARGRSTAGDDTDGASDCSAQAGGRPLDASSAPPSPPPQQNASSRRRRPTAGYSGTESSRNARPEPSGVLTPAGSWRLTKQRSGDDQQRGAGVAAVFVPPPRRRFGRGSDCVAPEQQV